VTVERYDVIGLGYEKVRRPDPRIAAQIRRVIGDARSVVNVGAGSGSYEPTDVLTVAVEPSEVMIAQRGPHAAPVVRGRAEQLPFSDGRFDVGLAVLTVHHWTDAAAGLSELVRVSDRQVVVTWDPVTFAERFWFARDYLPQALRREETPGTVEPIADALESSVTVQPVLIPADCTDGFYAAYWARPEAFLDPRVRAGISVFALADPAMVETAISRLEADLRSGAWDRRYGGLRNGGALDLGYRLVVAG